MLFVMSRLLLLELLLPFQVDSLKIALKHLRNENIRLKSQQLKVRGRFTWSKLRWYSVSQSFREFVCVCFILFFLLLLLFFFHSAFRFISQLFSYSFCQWSVLTYVRDSVSQVASLYAYSSVSQSVFQLVMQSFAKLKN